MGRKKLDKKVKNSLTAAYIWLFITTASVSCTNPLDTTGSNKSQIETGYHPGINDPVISPPPFGSVGGVKASPGAKAAIGNTIALSYRATNTNERIKGTTISGQFSIQKSQMR